MNILVVIGVSTFDAYILIFDSYVPDLVGLDAVYSYIFWPVLRSVIFLITEYPRVLAVYCN